MLRKLIKYEWKATARECLPIYLALLISALVFRIMPGPGGLGSAMYVNSRFFSIMEGMAGFLYAGLLTAAFVVTFVVLIKRFYKSLLGDEGYLMFTMPVSIAQHLWSKAIIAVLFSFLCGLAVLLSTFILFMNGNAFMQFPHFFAEVFRMIGREPISLLYLIEILALMLGGMLVGVFSIYLCIAIGHLAKKHRVAGAIGAYFGLSIIGQFVMVGIFYIISATGLDYWAANLSSYHLSAQLFVLFCAVLEAAYFAVCFMGTRYILKNRLNLE